MGQLYNSASFETALGTLGTGAVDTTEALKGRHISHDE